MPQNYSEYTNSCDQDVILSDSAIPKVAQIEVFPRGNSILSNFGVPRIAQNRVMFEEFTIRSLIRVPRLAQNDVLVEGFGVFGATFRNLWCPVAHAP